MSVTRKTNFTSHSINKPKLPHEGQKLDLEFDNLVDGLQQVSDALADIRRDDGQLKNGLITADNLSSDLATNLAGTLATDLEPLKDHVTSKADQAQLAADQAQQATNDAETAVQTAQAAAQHSDQILSDIELNKDQIETALDLSQQAQQAADQAQQAAKLLAEQAESYQDGAKAAYQGAKQAAETALEAVGPAASHLQDLDNPHQVTHDQVDSHIAHWNARRIMDKPVSVENRKADGLQRVVVWDPAKDHYTHAVFSAMAGGGMKYPVSWVNEADGTILVLRDDGNGGLHWVLEPKPQRGKKSVSKFIELSDTPALIDPGKALFGAEDTAGRFIEFRDVYDKLQIDALLLPIDTSLTQLQSLINGIQQGLDIKLIQLQSLLTQRIDLLTQKIDQVVTIVDDLQQGGTVTNAHTTSLIAKTEAANRWHIWSGI